MKDNTKNKTKKKKTRNILYFILIFILLFIHRLISFAIGWFLEEFGTTPFGQIVFHLQVPLTGTGSGAFTEFVVDFFADSAIILLSYLFIIIVAAVWLARKKKEKIFSFTMKLKKNEKNISISLQFIAKLFVLLGVIFMLCLEIRNAYIVLGVEKYLYNMENASTIYEDYYVNASEADIEFPENKKNLIYIFMESMEVSYANKSHGGAWNESLIPKLTNMALEGECFGTEEMLSGGYSLANTTWTMSGIIAQTAGVTTNLPIDHLDGNRYKLILEGATALGDILESEGYYQAMVLGSDSEFAGLNEYAKEHGNYEIFDVNTFKEEGKIPEDYEENWGIEDLKLLEYSKEIITDAAESGKPFNVTIQTLDTHFPDGYKCVLCGSKFENQMENVIACADSQIYRFVEWIKKQDFYEDTVIIIAGDHPSMEKLIPDLIGDGSYERDVYFAVINSDTEPVADNVYRQYSTLDMFPTTLAALGCKIENNKLGLGVNLYSQEETLIEKLGKEKCDNELAKVSLFYNREILKIK